MKVQEWFAKKEFAKQGKKLYGDDVLAIFGESEKAYHAIIGCFSTSITVWVPKSLCIGEENDGKYNTTTYRCKNFNDAVATIKWHIMND